MKYAIILIGLLLSSSFMLLEAYAQGVNLPNDFGTLVYTFSGRYYVKDSHDIITSSDTPDTVIKTALDRGGEIYIAGGTYTLTKNFAGFDLKKSIHLKLASDATIVVPSGYDGYVLRLKNGTSSSVIEGGIIIESYPVHRNWIGILMQGGKNGVYFNSIQNMAIHYPHTVIDFNATSGQWINANTFANIKGTNFVTGIEFDFNGEHISGIDGFDGNTFRDMQFQSDNATTYGVKDIRHDRNAFYNVQFWDLPHNAISSSVDPSASNTLIIGGLMTHQGFIDEGVNTIILDSWHNNISSNSSLSLSLINRTITSPMTNAIITSNPDVKIGSSSESNLTSSLQIKIDAKLWNQSKISDEIFGKSVKHLIDIGLIEKNYVDSPSNASAHMPTWFKNNAGWWSDGKISASEFISEVQYLLDNGIMRLSS